MIPEDVKVAIAVVDPGSLSVASYRNFPNIHPHCVHTGKTSLPKLARLFLDILIGQLRK